MFVFTPTQLAAAAAFFTPHQMAAAQTLTFTGRNVNVLQTAISAGFAPGPNQATAVAGVPNPPTFPQNMPWSVSQLQTFYPTPGSWPAGSAV